MVSPCWFTLKQSGKKFIIDGEQNIDIEWIEAVKANTSTPVILPRINMEGFQQESYSTFIFVQEVQDQIFEMIIALLLKFGFEGLVFDAGYLGFRLNQAAAEHKLMDMYITLGEQLKTNNLKYVLVVPPYLDDNPNLFTSKDFNQLTPHVDYFSMMTYDYSRNEIGPLSPVHWIFQSANRILEESPQELNSKLLLGIPFFGMVHSKTSHEVILRNQFLQELRRHKPKVYWDDNVKEHFFKYTENNNKFTMYFPTLMFIHERLELAKRLGCGVAVWEIGQGLDYFYDLF